MAILIIQYSHAMRHGSRKRRSERKHDGGNGIASAHDDRMTARGEPDNFGYGGTEKLLGVLTLCISQPDQPHLQPHVPEEVGQDVQHVDEAIERVQVDLAAFVTPAHVNDGKTTQSKLGLGSEQ